MFKQSNMAKCPKCKKSVYAAEEILAGGQKYHKLCCRCQQCNKMLDSMTLAEKDGNLYCKACHGKNFGPVGYGYGGGAGTLSNTGANVVEGKTVQPITSAFCVQCGEDLQGGRFCGSCGADKDAIQTRQQARRPPPQRPSTRPSPAAVKVGGGSSDKCRQCGKTVYFAEKVLAGGGIFHRACCVCANCNRILDSTNMNERGNEVFCKTCYATAFGPKGYGFGQGAGALSQTE